MNSSHNVNPLESNNGLEDDDYSKFNIENQDTKNTPLSESQNSGHLSASADRYESDVPLPGGTNDPLDAPRKGFNKNRKIIIKNVPPVRYEEVKEFLGAYAVSNISISKRARHAVATLVNGEEAEDAVETLSGRNLMGTPVIVGIYPNECLLCVAHLPLNLDEQDFRSMVGEYGAIERAFLMLNKEGSSKGYGFVEFAHNKELSTQACNILDGKRVGSCMLHCDFLDTSIVSFDHLQSRCLYIDHLPPAYDNEMELRNLFSFIKPPTFFRLHVADTQSPGKNTAGSFAVVEYENDVVAENSQQRSNGLMLCQQRIHVTFCLPGRPGIDIFSTLLAARSNNSKQALLPNPTSTVLPTPVRDSLTNPLVFNLLAQNPALLQNFQKVLQLLQQQTQPHSQKPGLLGVAPHLRSSPLMNPNLQVALLAVIVAKQLQQCEPSLLTNTQLPTTLASNQQNEQNNAGGMTRPSLLGNPMIAQANSLLQNLPTQTRSTIATVLGNPAHIQPNTVVQKLINDEEAMLENGTGFNINQLTNWSQVIAFIQKHIGGAHRPPSGDVSESQLSLPLRAGQGLLGDAPAGAMLRKPPLLGMPPGGNLKPGLLGDAPRATAMGRPILGAGPAPDGDKRTLLGNGPTMSYPDSGAKDDTNGGPANPLLAIYLEGIIRRQLESMRGGGGGPVGPGGLGGPLVFSGPPPPHSMQPPPHRPPPPHAALPPPHILAPLQTPPLGPPPTHMPPPGVLAHMRPPTQPQQGPLLGGSLLGNPHFMGQSRMPAPPNTSMPPPAGPKTFNKTLLPNPVSNPMNNNPMNNNPMNNNPMNNNPMNNNHINMSMSSAMGNQINVGIPTNNSTPITNNLMSPLSSRKPGLLGEHPGAVVPTPQWRQPEEMRHKPDYSCLNSTMPEKRGLLGDAPPNLHGGRNDLLGMCSPSDMSENGSQQNIPTRTLNNSNWGNDLWENESLQDANDNGDNIGRMPMQGISNNGNNESSSSSSYLQQYQKHYNQYVNQYSQLQAAANTLNQISSRFNTHQEVLLPEDPMGTVYMPPPKTPMIGMKRTRPHLLPSPESSPEGSYIGQHSQGIGGHYATSYTKKRRLL